MPSERSDQTQSAISWTEIGLFLAAGLSFVLATAAAFIGRTSEFFGYLFMVLFFCLIARPNAIAELTLPLGMGLKTRLQEIRENLDEIKMLAKQVGEIGLHNLYSTKNWFATGDREIKEFDELRDGIFNVLDRLGGETRGFAELYQFEYVKVCYFYLEYLQMCLGDRSPQLANELGRISRTYLYTPAPPDLIEETFRKFGKLADWHKTSLVTIAISTRTGSIAPWSVGGREIVGASLDRLRAVWKARRECKFFHPKETLL